MNTTAHIILTILCFAALAALPAFLPGEEPKPPAFRDCPREARLNIPVTATYNFPYCIADSTVWMYGRWNEPTSFEQRHINLELKKRED